MEKALNATQLHALLIINKTEKVVSLTKFPKLRQNESLFKNIVIWNHVSILG